jgi:hypothetical protein
MMRSISLALLLTCAMGARAQTNLVAYDNGDDPAYAGNPNSYSNSNGGFGYGPWQLGPGTLASAGGTFMASPGTGNRQVEGTNSFAVYGADGGINQNYTLARPLQKALIQGRFEAELRFDLAGPGGYLGLYSGAASSGALHQRLGVGDNNYLTLFGANGNPQFPTLGDVRGPRLRVRFDFDCRRDTSDAGTLTVTAENLDTATSTNLTVPFFVPHVAGFLVGNERQENDQNVMFDGVAFSQVGTWPAGVFNSALTVEPYGGSPNLAGQAYDLIGETLPASNVGFGHFGTGLHVNWNSSGLGLGWTGELSGANTYLVFVDVDGTNSGVATLAGLGNGTFNGDYEMVDRTENIAFGLQSDGSTPFRPDFLIVAGDEYGDGPSYHNFNRTGGLNISNTGQGILWLSRSSNTFVDLGGLAQLQQFDSSAQVGADSDGSRASRMVEAFIGLSALQQHPGYRHGAGARIEAAAIIAGGDGGDGQPTTTFLSTSRVAGPGSTIPGGEGLNTLNSLGATLSGDPFDTPALSPLAIGPQGATATFPAAAQRIYRVETTTDLQAPWTVTQVLAGVTGTLTVSNLPTSAAAAMVRLGWYSFYGDFDTDGDGLRDYTEFEYGLNPFDPTDAGGNPDGDLMPNDLEILLGQPINVPNDPSGIRLVWFPTRPARGTSFEVSYRPHVTSPLFTAAVIYCQSGHNGFQDVTQTPLAYNSGSRLTNRIAVPFFAYEMNFVFHDGNGNFDNNGGLDYYAACQPLTPADADADGMPDTWETSFGLNPASAADAGQDPDGDTLPNGLEYLLTAHPYSLSVSPMISNNAASVTLRWTPAWPTPIGPGLYVTYEPQPGNPLYVHAQNGNSIYVRVGHSNFEDAYLCQLQNIAPGLYRGWLHVPYQAQDINLRMAADLAETTVDDNAGKFYRIPVRR